MKEDRQRLSDNHSGKGSNILIHYSNDVPVQGSLIIPLQTSTALPLVLPGVP